MTFYSLYKKVGHGIAFEKPHIDPVTLKPVFNERVSYGSGRQFTSVDIKKFAVELLNTASEIDEITRYFHAHAHDDNALRKFVAEFE